VWLLIRFQALFILPSSQVILPSLVTTAVQSEGGGGAGASISYRLLFGLFFLLCLFFLGSQNNRIARSKKMKKEKDIMIKKTTVPVGEPQERALMLVGEPQVWVGDGGATDRFVSIVGVKLFIIAIAKESRKVISDRSGRE